MKNLRLLLAALFASIACASAQIQVEVVMEQVHFLPGETVNAEVRITNRSGQTLELGADEQWLTFIIESRDGSVVAREGEVPVTGAVTLESSKVLTRRVNLQPYFRLGRPGGYSVTATVAIKAWGQHFSSKAKPFDIIRGSRLWFQEVGVPKAPGAENPVPERRIYTLHQANYLRKQLVLYLQVTDPSGKIYRVFPIGPMISFGQAHPQVDKFSNLHLLYQDGPQSFNYTAVDTDGNVFLRRAYEIESGRRPRLTSSDGLIHVEGGRRVIKANDLPAPGVAEHAPQTTNP